ncbi:unnamed protein product [Fraxinus pennsylvanica]|uniref:Phospholipid/glycerol acyltransferase domain-containing protein n=1 Tax=Fraxinus pennsylvanica TaxID=56036 RepID=A0AAD2DSD7_9LAMI|nr:unnamed protein product [Fraxinus pennsylvanica]
MNTSAGNFFEAINFPRWKIGLLADLLCYIIYIHMVLFGFILGIVNLFCCLISTLQSSCPDLGLYWDGRFVIQTAFHRYRDLNIGDPLPVKKHLVNKGEKDLKMMGEILSRGNIVVCPEGTTCREPYLLRFSPLFAELSDDIIPVALYGKL